MTFRNNLFLYFGLLGVGVLALAWLQQRRAQKRLAQVAEPSVLWGLVDGASLRLFWIRTVLVATGVALLAITLAGPQYGSRTTVMAKRGIDIVIALDFSKSMLARDVRPSRIERAKAEILRFVSELDGDRVGVVAFAGETIEFPMTTDYSAVGLFFRDMNPFDMPVGGTAIGRALTAAGRMLERANAHGQSGAQVGTPDNASTGAPSAGAAAGSGSAAAARNAAASRSRVVLLLTDGEDHEGEPLAAARALGEQGVRVFTIGIGTRTGEPIPTYAPDGTWTGYQRDESGNVITTAFTESNERQLREIAEVSHGRFFAAGRGSVGVDAIRREIRAMHQDEHRTRRVTVQEDRYLWVLLPAFVLLVLEALLPMRWRSRRQQAGDGGKASEVAS